MSLGKFPSRRTAKSSSLSKLGVWRSPPLKRRNATTNGLLRFTRHNYPKVNLLTTRLVRASLLAQTIASVDRRQTDEITSMLTQIRNDAVALVNDPALWQPVKPDDAIWIPASRGEARLLAQDWQLAADAYQQALAAAKEVSFARSVMAKQVKTLLNPAFGRLGIVVPAPLTIRSVLRHHDSNLMLASWHRHLTILKRKQFMSTTYQPNRLTLRTSRCQQNCCRCVSRSPSRFTNAGRLNASHRVGSMARRVMMQRSIILVWCRMKNFQTPRRSSTASPPRQRSKW